MKTNLCWLFCCILLFVFVISSIETKATIDPRLARRHPPKRPVSTTKPDRFWRVVQYGSMCGPRIWLTNQEPKILNNGWVEFIPTEPKPKIPGKHRVVAYIVEPVPIETKVSDGDGQPKPEMYILDGKGGLKLYKDDEPLIDPLFKPPVKQ